jgi:xanthine/uracil permease
MKIKELLTKIALCIIPTMLSIFAFSFENEMKSGEAAFLVSGIATSNITFIVMYVFLKEMRLWTETKKCHF